MSDERVERVARAKCVMRGIDPDKPYELSYRQRIYYSDMVGGTPEHVASQIGKPWWLQFQQEAKEFCAMIDAALKAD